MKRFIALTVAFIMAVCVCPALARDVRTVKVDPTSSSPFGAFEGWGTSLCWWAEEYGDLPEVERKALSKAFFDKDEGLGLNFVRFNIGGGDSPDHNHLSGGRAVPGWLNADGSYNKNADPNQVNILLDAIEYGADIVECFSNSPPYTMTVSGCTAGGEDPNRDNIAPDKLDDFAAYLAEVVGILQTTYGVRVDTLEPLNEPNTNFWKKDGGQEGCHVGAETQNALILACADALGKKGLSNVAVAAPDEHNTQILYGYINKLSPEAVAALGRFNVHSYDTANAEKLRDEIAKTGKPLYMTETDYNATAGVDAELMGPALWFAQKITSDLNTLKSNAWTTWQVCETMQRGRESVGGYWGLSQYDRETHTLELFRKYYAYGQFSKFIRGGDYLIDTDCENVLAAHNRESGKTVLVVTNATGGDIDYSFDLSSFGGIGKTYSAWRTSETQNIEKIAGGSISGKTLNVSVPQSTITTYVIEPYQSALSGMSISAKNNEKTVFVGDTLEMQVTFSPSGFADKKLIWSLEGGDATIEQNGTVHFAGEGNFTIKAALASDESVCDTYAVSAVKDGSVVNLISDCGGLAMAQSLTMDGSITQYKNVDYSAAKWIIHKKGSEWSFTNLRTGKKLADNGALTVLADDFLWTLGEKNGSFSFSKGERYIDLYNWKTVEGAQIDMYTFTGSNNQYWSMRIASSLCAAEPLFEKVGAPLEGKLFATEPWNGDVAAQNALDKNFDTFFDSKEGDAGYIGLDLGDNAPAVTSVRYAPRFWYFSRMVGGVFQGANTKDGEWTDLAKIEHTPRNSRWSQLSFKNAASYRYVRYKTPENGYCNISEIEFYSKPLTVTASFDGLLRMIINNNSSAAGVVVAIVYDDGEIVTEGVDIPACESMEKNIELSSAKSGARVYVISESGMEYGCYVKL